MDEKRFTAIQNVIKLHYNSYSEGLLCRRHEIHEELISILKEELKNTSVAKRKKKIKWLLTCFPPKYYRSPV